jgi:hypothetical protein
MHKPNPSERKKLELELLMGNEKHPIRKPNRYSGINGSISAAAH